jgi:hypothetical protein
MLTETADVRWWQELVQGLRNEIEAKGEHIRALEGWLKEREHERDAAHAEIEAMQATRVWRLGTRYWSLRDRLLRRRLR